MSPSHELPPLSDLQFLALGVVLERDASGRAIRQVVAGYGVRRSAAAFYQLMARLERDGLVHGWYETVAAGQQTVRERRYRITRAGEKAWRETRAFYDAVARAAKRGEWSRA
jgi:DNA-binding PadR family transcriptional regulator